MQATLTFNLPEEQHEHRDALDGTNWKLIVWNLDNLIRQALKHGHNLKTADEALEEIRRELYDQLDTRNLMMP